MQILAIRGLLLGVSLAAVFVGASCSEEDGPGETLELGDIREYVETAVHDSLEDIMADDVLADAPDSAEVGEVDDSAEVDEVDDSAEVDEVDDSAEVDVAQCLTDRNCSDGVFCNGVERCYEDRCFDAVGLLCDDAVDCTVDTCDELGGHCLHEPDDALCAPDQVCDPKAGCFRPGDCSLDLDCSDGFVCNGDEVCVDGICHPGNPLDCDDTVFCTVDGCVEEVGSCQHVPDHTLCLPTELCDLTLGCIPRPPCNHSDDCDDASFCNGTETCDLGVHLCSPGSTPVATDGIPCTIDQCSDQLVMVVHTPDPARCSDGLFCNGAEVCHPVEGCRSGAPPPLSDGVNCTADRCDEGADFVEHTPDNRICDDDLFCNGLEFCHPIEGCSQGDPPRINDGVGCTIDTCSEVQQEVLHVATDERCDDGLFCNGVEACDPLEDCQVGAAPVVDDDVSCTVDRCDEANDVVVHTPDDAFCDNGLFCDGQESCHPVSGCLPSSPPPLEDAFTCTTDVCDETNDIVLHIAEDSACQNGEFCDGEEICDPDYGCVQGAPLQLGDGVDCTIDTCSEVDNTIHHVASDEVCSDDLFCNGTEWCHPIAGCQEGNAPSVPDTFECTIDRCDELADRVVHEPNHALCDNSIFCDGQEICSEVVGCQSGPPRADGSVCLDDPRSICRAGDCGISECGDEFIDEGAGETCDDGNHLPDDGCDAGCQLETFDYNGTFILDAEDVVDYYCDWVLGPVLDIHIDRFTFSDAGGTLTIYGGPTEMTQQPVPTGLAFSASGSIPGGCTETYALFGEFVTEDTFEGEFRISLSGYQCELTTCTNQIFRNITGTRQ